MIFLVLFPLSFYLIFLFFKVKPWKNRQNFFYALVPFIFWMLASLIFCLNEYKELMAKHAWTAATLFIPMSFTLTILFASLGGALGWFLKEWQVKRSKQSIAHVLVSLVLSLYVPYKIMMTKQREEYLLSLKSFDKQQIINFYAQFKNNQGLTPLQYEELYRLAGNKNCPLEILTEMSEDSNHLLRAAVAANSQTPLKLIVKLSHDPHSDVRYYVLYHPQLPRSDLERLSSDHDYLVNKVANEKLESLKELQKK